LSGIQLVSLIRRLSGLPPIRLIALSGYGRDTDVEEAKAAGFDDYLMKPVEISSLIAAIERVERTAMAADSGPLQLEVVTR
jgi:two-component system CheB/CheR fusion protein